MTISYWQAQAQLPRNTEALPHLGTIETELCIVGAGIIGSGVTRFASEMGLTGIVVEARDAAMGATGRNAGFILSGIADNYDSAVRKYGRDAARDLWALSVENRSLMLQYSEELGVPTDRCGSLLLAESEEEAEDLARSAELLAEDGFPGEFTPYDPLNRGFFAALRRPADGVTQPALLDRALLESSGFVLVAESPVTHFESDSDGVVVYSERATIRARYLFLATNAFSAQLHPYFEGKVVPMRGQIYVTEPAPLIFDTAGYSHFGFHYFRQVPEPERPGYGRWLLGGGRHRFFDTENNNWSIETSDALQAHLEAWTAEHFPEFADLPITYRWAGTMGFTTDGLPLVGLLPSHPRVAFSVGFNGHGMGLGILVAKRALHLLLEGADPGIFNAERLSNAECGMRNAE